MPEDLLGEALSLELSMPSVCIVVQPPLFVPQEGSSWMAENISSKPCSPHFLMLFSRLRIPVLHKLLSCESGRKTIFGSNRLPSRVSRGPCLDKPRNLEMHVVKMPPLFRR